MVTYAENQLILAEANHRLGTGTPLTNLNNARTSAGLTALSGLSGGRPAARDHDSRSTSRSSRTWTCTTTTSAPACRRSARRGPSQAVIGRILYSDTERAANPNIPLPTNQPSRNDNDPQACPRPA
jgi:hypothetical protein